MKRLTALLFICIGFVSLSWAMDGCHQHLSPEEFKAKKKAFIIEKAGLTADEANKFFPVYYQLEDKKRDLNDRAWRLMQKGKDEKTTDDQYEEILNKIYDLRIQIAQLEKEYYGKFKEILSPKKIYNVQRAEMRFHRELVRDINQHNHNKKENNNKGPR